MRLPFRVRPLALLALLVPAAAGAQAVVRTPQVTASLLSYGSWVQPGAPLAVAVRLEVSPEWYVYWHQPGEAGLPTTVSWQLPRGYRTGGLRFPLPERYVVAGLATHVLRGDVMLFDTIVAPPVVRGRQTLRATVRYGVCRDVCIPQQVELSLTLPVRDRVPDAGFTTRTIFERGRRRLPHPPPAHDRIALRRDGARLCLAIEHPPSMGEGPVVDSVLFFPSTPEPWAGAAYLRRARAPTRPVFLLPPASPPPSRVTGVLAFGQLGVTVDATVERGECGE